MKSTSGQRHKISRRRTLKRGAHYRSPRDADLKFLYAAYKKGVFEELQPGYDFDDFATIIIDDFEHGEYYIGVAPNNASAEHTEIPVCLFSLLRRHQGLGEPHVIWFPWATDRNKIEIVLKFLTEMRRDMTLAIFAREEDAPFFERMKHYGVVKHGCKVFKFWPDGGNGRFYQSIE